MTPSQFKHLREWLDNNLASVDTAYADKALRELCGVIEKNPKILETHDDTKVVGYMDGNSVSIDEDDKCTKITYKISTARSDNIKQPNHYTWHPSGIECKTITSAFNYNLGTAIAYIWRCEHKGTKRQDLEKAIQHLTFELENMEDD